MHILQLCKKFPYPLNDGESIAVTYLSRAFNMLNCDISLLAMNTSKHYTDISTLPDSFKHYSDVRCTYLDNEVTTIGAFKNLFSDKSYHLSRFYSEEFEEELIELLANNTYQIIQIESLYLAQYIDVIKEYSNALIVMRAHNVEHEIWDRITANTFFYPKRLYLKYLTRKLREAEKKFLGEYDYLVAISDRDLNKFRNMGYKNGATIAPIGVQINDYQPLKFSNLENEIRPCFIGSLDWMPNIEGMQWFLKEIWPAVVKENADIHFHIAGRNARNEKMFRIENTTFHGEVKCARSWLSNYNVMVVPLLSGSGMRAKIIEGMALGMVVITTSIGLEGIPATHKKNVLVADSQEEFLDTIKYLRRDSSRIKFISENARTFAEANYDNISIASQLLKTYEKYLNQSDSTEYSAENKEVSYTTEA